MAAVNHEVFDDLLIGNFMKTTLHNMKSLYEGDFNFYLTKYGDNGGALSNEELEKYFKIYRKRIGFEYFYDRFFSSSIDLAHRLRLAPKNKDSQLFRVLNRVYYYIR